MKTDYLILGGGIAGLSAARRLIDLGIKPLLIEGGTYPCHKVCGEFISPSGVEILKNWNIHPIPIYQAHLHTQTKSLDFTFPIPAGSLSHFTLDNQLANQISSSGASLLSKTMVQSLSQASHPNELHTIRLSSGKEILTKHLIIATGRLPGFSNPTPSAFYTGFKAHFSGIDLGSTLEMFSFPGIYLGAVPVENDRTNIACLAKNGSFKHVSSPEKMINNLIKSHPLLNRLLSNGKNLFDGWMKASVPAFGFRSPPQWPRTYWIGDSASTIPPASGNGLSLALASGYLAAEFAIRDDPDGFKHAWKKRCAFQILFGKGLHQLFLNPFLGNQAIRMNQWFPSMTEKIFSLTRDPGF